jgi:diaminopimelate decarboxylase
MEPFAYAHHELSCEGIALRALADAVGTPAYVYSSAALLDRYQAYDRAFAEVPHLICYAVKANANLGVISTLARAGAGADIVSGGELYRALRAGMSPRKIIFSGVGKTRDEMREALKAEILMFNAESVGELHALDEVARAMGTRAPVALRVNPTSTPDAPYIATGLRSAKFGIHRRRTAHTTWRKRCPGSRSSGVQMHIGPSSPGPRLSRQRGGGLLRQAPAERHRIAMVDIGGLGIRYRDEVPPTEDGVRRDAGDHPA